MQTSLKLFEEKESLTYNFVHRDLATFKSGLAKEVHKWFRLTPSFSPDLVRSTLEHFGYEQKSKVLDPFSGASTTLIESQLMGLRCYGFELNPFLYFVGKTSLNWDLDLPRLKKLRDSLSNTFEINKVLFAKASCEELRIPVPPIHNVYRWWRADVLKDLLILKEAIHLVTDDGQLAYRDFFILCLAGVMVPDLTNVTLGKLQLHFIDRANDRIDVRKSYFHHLEKMISDLEKIKAQTYSNYSKLFNTDSTVLNGVEIKEKIDFVVTSPPYPNRYSYVWNTRPFLYFFDIFSDAKQASDLDKASIGGTWGTATSCLSKGIIEPCDDLVKEFVEPVAAEIRAKDNLMANYLMKYFNLLWKQINVMDEHLAPNAKVAYVVGNSRIKEVYVEVDVILSKMFENSSLGFKNNYVNRFRRRNSGKDLFESIVYAEK
jgi:hypothetical protein